MTMRSKLVRRLLILAAVLTVAVGSAGGFYVYRKAKIRSQYKQMMAEGLAAAAAGRNEQALDLLHGYMQRDPNNIEVLIAYTRIRPLVPLPKHQEIADTILVLRHLLKLPKTDNLIAQKRQLLDLYVRTRYWSECEALADELLPDGAKPGKDDVPVLRARTILYAAEHDSKKALNWAEPWSDLAPSDLDAQLRLLELVHETQLFDGLSKYKKKDQKLSELDVAESLAAACERSLANPSGPDLAATTRPVPADPRPAIIWGDGFRLAGNGKSAIDCFKAATSARSMDVDAGGILIHELDALGDSADSLPVLQRLARESNDPAVHAALARRSWETGDWKTVLDASSDLNSSDPNTDSELLALRASALKRADRSSDASRLIAVLAGRRDDPVAMAWAVIASQEETASQGVNAQLVASLCTPAADKSAYLSYFLADADARLGETELAIAAFQKAVAANSTWAAPAMRLSELLANLGRDDAAFQAGREAVRRQPTYAAVVCLYRAWDLCVQNGLAKSADMSPGRLLQGLADLHRRRTDDGQVLCLWVDALGATGKTTEAVAALRDGLKSDAQHLGEQSLLRLTAISRRYKLGMEDQCLAASRAHHGITPEFAYAAAAGQLAAGDAAGAEKTFEAVRAGAPNPQDSNWRLAWAVYLDLARDPRAKDQMVQLADERLADVRIQLAALSAQSTRQERQFMQRTIERVRQLTGDDGIAWQLAKARWLIEYSTEDSDKQEEARLLSNVVRLAPDQPEAHVLLSQCAQRDGNLPEAIDQMRAATALLPNSPNLGNQLADLLRRHGDLDAARDELSRVASMPSSAADQRHAAILAAAAGDPKLALTLAQNAEAKADGTQDLLLAQIYWNNGKVREADQVCQKLLAKPDLAIVQFAADFYGSQGKLDEAARALSHLDELKLDPGVKELVLADFADRQGNHEAALKYIDQATTLAKGNPQVWKALIAFQLSQGQPQRAADAINQAMQHVPSDPVIKALHGQQDLLVSADAIPDPTLQLVALALARDPSNLSMRQALHTIVDDRNAKVLPAHLAEDAKQLVDQNPTSVPLWLYLVQCQWAAAQYDDRMNAPGAAARYDEAMNSAVRAAEKFAADPAPQKLYVRLLEDRKRWVEVLAEAQKWRDRSMAHPIEPDLHIAAADLMLQLPHEAMRQLEPYVLNASLPPQAGLMVLPLYAKAQKMDGHTDTAALMEPLLKQGPAGRQAWVNFAVTSLDPPEAVTWLDRADKLIASDSLAERLSLAQAWMSLARDRNYPPGFDKALAIMAPFVQKPDAAEQLVLAYAVNQETAGQFKEAERQYRRALKMAPDDFIARNNLAMLLAKNGQDLTEALALAQAAVQQHPEIAALYDTLAFVQGKVGLYPQAVASEQKAISMMPKNVQYRVTLAQLMLDHKDRIGADRVMQDLKAEIPDLAGEPESLRKQIDSISAALTTRAQAN